MLITKNCSGKLTISDIYHLSKFVVEQNFNYHKKKNDFKNIEKNILTVYLEEIQYLQNSKIFVNKNDLGEINGVIRVLKWNHIDKLPLQNLFGINPLLILENKPYNEIWHIGRFAIKKGINDGNLLKKLMVCAVSPVCSHTQNIAFAECDRKLLRVMSLLGINAKTIGKPINYLGSETIPVSFTYNCLIDFYNKNKDLISNNNFDLQTSTL